MKVSPAEHAVPGTTREPWRKLLDPLSLMGLTAFAVTQPILSDFRAGAGFFVARRAEPLDIILLVATLTLVPGLVVVLVTVIAGLFSPAARALVHSVMVGLLMALIAHTSLVRLLPMDWSLIAVISVMVGVVVGVVHSRYLWVRNFLRYLIPAPLIFALFFLFTPPVVGLVLPAGSEVAAVEIDASGPVVFLVLDEFPVVSLLDADGNLDADRYPNFADLAAKSTWYRNTVAAHDNTLWAVPAILSAKSPDSSLLPTASNYPGNLFTLLASSHEMKVVEPFTDLCPSDICRDPAAMTLFDRYLGLVRDSVQLYTMMLTPDPTEEVSVSDPFDEFLTGAMDRVNEEAAVDQLARFDDFVHGIDDATPTLHFLHMFLPHAPFHLYPSGVRYNDGDELLGQNDGHWTEPVLADQAYQRHLLQAEAVDGLIGDLVEQLENQGIFEEALVVVTADHGISFREGEARRAATESNVYELAMVPLFIKAPHQTEGVVDARLARTTDVLPTLAELLGVDLPWGHDGISLIGDAPSSAEAAITSLSGRTVALERVEEGINEAAGYVASVFQDDGGDIDLYAFGPYSALVGTSTDQIEESADAGLRAHIEEGARFAHVQPNTGWVPGFIHGELSGDVDEHMYVAVALNGQISTVVPTFEESGSTKFTAILPDEEFTEGFNSLEFFSVIGQPGSPQLDGIASDHGAGFELVLSRDDELSVVDSEGRSWRVTAGINLVGFVDTATWEHSGFEAVSPMDLQLQGWAVDERSLTPAQKVVFFADSEFAGADPVDVERPGIVDIYETDDVLVSGFLARLPHFSPDDPPTVRAFALFEDKAVELVILDTALAGIESG